MKAANLSSATYLISKRRAMVDYLNRLNAINGGEDKSFPTDVVSYVDHASLAKGCIPLLVDEIAKVERELSDIGVEL